MSSAAPELWPISKPKQLTRSTEELCILKSVAQEQNPCILAMTRWFENRLKNWPATFNPHPILTFILPPWFIRKEDQGMWGDGVRPANLTAFVMRGDSLFFPWEDICDHRDNWLLLVYRFL